MNTEKLISRDSETPAERYRRIKQLIDATPHAERTRRKIVSRIRRRISRPLATQNGGKA